MDENQRREPLEYNGPRHVNSVYATILELGFGASYLHLRAMSTRFHFVTPRAASLFNLAVCIVSVLMLLTFPMQRVHQYTNHFRTPQVRRLIERHTSVAQPEAGTTERIAYQAVLPTLAETIETGDVVAPVVDIECSPQVPLSRLLLRLKQGFSRSSSQDPLL